MIIDVVQLLVQNLNSFQKFIKTRYLLIKIKILPMIFAFTHLENAINKKMSSIVVFEQGLPLARVVKT
jgi:hypothetical protein